VLGCIPALKKRGFSPWFFYKFFVKKKIRKIFMESFTNLTPKGKAIVWDKAKSHKSLLVKKNG